MAYTSAAPITDGSERLLQAALLHDDDGNAIDKRPFLVRALPNNVTPCRKSAVLAGIMVVAWSLLLDFPKPG
jgi:hypothetical protein